MLTKKLRLVDVGEQYAKFHNERQYQIQSYIERGLLSSWTTTSYSETFDDLEEAKQYFTEKLAYVTPPKKPKEKIIMTNVKIPLDYIKEFFRGRKL